MSVHAFYKSLFKQHKRSSCYSHSGFTLIELLVSLFIGGILITGLLAIIVDFLKVDRREVILEQTQQDMSRAIDYIADDLREAVYVYTDPTVVTDELTDEPAGTPILAFWRPDAIENDLPDCGAVAAALKDTCDVLRLRQAAYSLVVYFERDIADAPDPDTWVGPSQIVRYELERFANLANLTERDGYLDPSSNNQGVSFANWERDDGDANTAGEANVLVDLLDAGDTPFNRAPLTDTTPCETTYGPSYVVVPATAAPDSNTNFFACVRNPDSDDPDDDGSSNQDVYIFLRGNIANLAGRALELGPVRDNNSGLPTLETRVLARGVINKSPVDN